MIVPKEFAGPIAIGLPVLGLRWLTTGSSTLTIGSVAVTLPKRLQELLDLPCVLQVHIESSQHEGPKILPLGDTLEFYADVTLTKQTRYATVPKLFVDGMHDLGWLAVHVKIDYGEPFVFMLSNRANGVVQIPLPKANTSRVHVRLTRASSHVPVDNRHAFDWCTIDFSRARIIEGDEIILPTIRSQLRMRRFTPWHETMWLLGLYYADGSKQGLDFSFTNKSRVCLQHMISCLEAMGISRSLMRLYVLWGRSSKDRVVSYYSQLGVKISRVAEDRSEGRHRRYHVAELHVIGSRGATELIANAISTLNLSELPIEARRAFTLGYIDGDGTITDDHGITLKLSSGSQLEAKRIVALVDEYLEREPGTEPAQKDGSLGWEFRRSISAELAVKLIEDGAFQHSVARAKLFHHAHRVLYPQRVMYQHQAHGYFHDNEPTAKCSELRRRLSALDSEWGFIQDKFPDEDDTYTGVKGSLYEFDRMYVLTRHRQTTNDPSVHHPDEKSAQIRDVLTDSNGLAIYEAFAGEGGCTAAYREFGQVTSRTLRDGDVALVTRKQLFEPTLFDVVDLDPYGYPFKALMAGALELLKPQGFLFVTSADPAKVHRAGSRRIHQAFFPEGPIHSIARL